MNFIVLQKKIKNWQFMVYEELHGGGFQVVQCSLTWQMLCLETGVTQICISYEVYTLLTCKVNLLIIFTVVSSSLQVFA